MQQATHRTGVGAMAFLGGDTEAMGAFSHALDARAAALSERVSHLEPITQDAAVWTGSDSEDFRSRSLSALRDLDSIAVRLRELGTEISEHSTEQDEASSTDPASSSDLAELLTGLPMSTPPDSVGLAGISAELGGQGDDGQRRDSRDGESDPTTVSTENAADEWNEAHPNGPTWEEHLNGYRVGPPDRPDIEYDDDYPFESKKGEDGIGDHLSLAEWKAKLHGAQLVRSDLDDSLALYEHYLGASGDPMSVDYEEGYQEDASIRENVDSEILASQASVQQMIEDGQEDFSFTGPPATHSAYPETENWQKTLGGYQQWSSGDVEVDENGRARMVVTVHVEDQYNFNAGQSDIASGAPDSANGRFSELGWAQGFNVTGEVQRVVEWDVDDPDDVMISAP